MNPLLAADFRQKARESLSRKWMTAVLAGLIATLLGAIGSSGPEINLEFKESGAQFSVDVAEQTIFSTGGSLNSDIGLWLAGHATLIGIAGIIMAVALFILGSMVAVGYARFNLNLVDGKEADLNDLFSYVSHWGNAVKAHFFSGLYVFLWSLLLIIPGILASYSYRLVDYLLAENPDLDGGEAITLSKQMMDGHRWRLFCLEFSFIGWRFLSALTLGIGGLWLTPYEQAAYAAFYRDVTSPQYQLEY